MDGSVRCLLCRAIAPRHTLPSCDGGVVRGWATSGAPRGRDLELPGRHEAGANIHLGLDWLASVYFGHVQSVGPRVLVLGGPLGAMAAHIHDNAGGTDVVSARRAFDS